MYESVLNQLRDEGLIVDHLELDTKSIVRCSVEGDVGKKLSGWYRIFSVLSKSGNTYYVGSYGNWKNVGLPEKGVAIKYEGKGLSDEDKAAIKAKQKQAQQDADKERRDKQISARERANEIWAAHGVDGSSKYLNRKKVAGFGIRYSRGAIIVPVINVNGELLGLQFIYPDGSKKFLTGTAKAGAFHLIGVLATDSPLVIAEGYATAASIHMATGYSVVVAFDAGNLVKVAAALRKIYPEQHLIIAADDDEAGRKYASQAAQKYSAVMAVPIFTQREEGERLTDFNDLHVREGLPAVKASLDPAKLLEEKPSNQVIKPLSNDEGSNGYQITDKGIYWVDPNTDGDASGRYWICSRLEVAARARDIDGRTWGLMVTFLNFDREPLEWFIPQRLFAASQGSAVLEGLLDRGLNVDPHRNSKNRLMDYLQRANPTKRIRLISKLGWSGNAYVSPLGVIGEPDEPIHYYTDRRLLNRSALAGSLDGWRDNVAAYCRGNPVLMFATCIPFSGPLLEWLSQQTIGFHMVGDSSLGKSSISTVAGSVCGGADYFRTWNTTAAALETMAAEHSDSVLILDEINQADPLTVGQTVYQLGNQEGKARATDTGTGTRAQHKWRLAWLSNGERTLKEIQSRAGKITEAGMEMRLLHIRADLHNSEFERRLKGIYQELHGFANGAKLSDHLKLEVEKNHGHAFQCFVDALTSTSPAGKKRLVQHLRNKIADFEHRYLSADASGQARRSSKGFALVGACGELATKLGVTGWSKGEAESAAALLFKDFLKNRGGEGNSEDLELLEHICHELKTKAESHFTRWDSAEPRVDTHQPRSMTRWGFRKINDTVEYGQDASSEEEFYIFKLAFRKEICKGFNYRKAHELLESRGALTSHKGRYGMYQALLPGGGHKKEDVYFIKMSALQELMVGPEVNKEAAAA